MIRISVRKSAAAGMVAIASVVFAATPAPAQDKQAPSTAPADKAGHHDHWDRHDRLPGEFIEARLAFIKTALKITPAQSTQWNALAEIMRKQAKARDAEITAMRAKKDDQHARPDPIEMLEHREKFLATASANLAEYVTALKPLYASLSDDQKEVAREVLAHHGHHGHRGFEK